MWPQEIDRAISKLEISLPRSARVVLDVGSEGETYRTVRQPWNQKFYDYLQNRGMMVLTMDLEASTKPDFLHDITKPVTAGQFDIYDLVVATHLLEHIPTESFGEVINNLETLVAPGGHLLVSVPHKYPYHARPIDTMYRPTWEELAQEFSGRLIHGETFEVDHTLPQYMQDPKCQVSLVLLQY